MTRVKQDERLHRGTQSPRSAKKQAQSAGLFVPTLLRVADPGRGSNSSIIFCTVFPRQRTKGPMVRADLGAGCAHAAPKVSAVDVLFIEPWVMNAS
jgi:hypothetical protein